MSSPAAMYVLIYIYVYICDTEVEGCCAAIYVSGDIICVVIDANMCCDRRYLALWLYCCVSLIAAVSLLLLYCCASLIAVLLCFSCPHARLLYMC